MSERRRIRVEGHLAERLPNGYVRVQFRGGLVSVFEDVDGVGIVRRSGAVGLTTPALADAVLRLVCY